MNEVETKNAVITSATLSNGDHGILTAWIGLDYGGICQSFGGVALLAPHSRKVGEMPGPHTREACGHFIWRVLEIAGVSEWSQLVGRTIRARSSWGGVEAIGHILKEDWFCPAEDLGWKR